MKKIIVLVSTLALAGCASSVTEDSKYNVVQMEEKPREVIKNNDPIIVTKITADGYVVKHGDHYHFVKGQVPSNAILQLDEKHEDHYQFNPNDVVEETADGYIVRHGDHYHYIPKIGNHTHEEHEEPYVFNPNDIVGETDSGYIIQHGNHQHFIFKKDIPWYKPQLPKKPHYTEPLIHNQMDFTQNFKEIEEYALKYNVRKEDIKIRDNVIFVKHHDHYHVYPSKFTNWNCFLEKYPSYKYDGEEHHHDEHDHHLDLQKFLDEIEEYALKYNVRKEDIKVKGSVIYIRHDNHYHAYPSRYNNWDEFLEKYPEYKYEGKEHHHHHEEEKPLNEQDLIQNDQVKMMLNVQLEKDEIDSPITKEDMKKLQSIDLFGSELDDYRFLKFAENLEELNLGNNEHFTQHELELLTGLNHLKILKLRGNSGVNDISILKDLKLEELWIDETGVGSLYQLKGFKNLKVLHAALLGAHDHAEGEEHDHSSKKHERHDELAQINSNILKEMILLEEVDISGSSLVDLSFTQNMNQLKKLYVEGTYLSSINGLNTNSLEVLKASGNEITDTKLDALSLKELDLGHNQIANIELNTPVLKSLKLAGNKLKALKLDMPKIEAIHLQNNEIENIDFLSGIKTLKSVQLQHNHIKDISKIKDLENLTSFDASYNEIEKIDSLVNLASLQQITLNHNKINDLENIEKLFKKNLFNLAIDEQELEIKAVENKINLPISNLEYFNIKKEKLEYGEITIPEDKVIEFKHKNNTYNNSYGGKIKIIQ